MTTLDDPMALARYRQAALVGMGAGGADLGPLSWLAARGRFSRAPAPALVPAAPWPQETRRIVPEAARAPLRALLTGRDARADGPYARRIAQEMRRRGLRPHPYDLKPLESFVGRHAARLGRHAQAWLAIVRPVQSDIREPYAEEVEALTEVSYAGASRAGKLAYLRGLRERTPAAARAFIEARLEGEPANVRSGIVGVLETGLGADDAPLLRTLAEDRAASVRDAATAMLARVPGTEAYEARKRDAASWLELKSSGLLHRTCILTIRKPGAVPDNKLDEAFAAAFEGVALADMAAPFDMPLADFVKAGRGEWRLARLLLARAVHEDRADLVAALTQAEGSDDGDVLVLAAALPALPLARRAAIVAAGVHPSHWTSLPRHALESLQEALEAPLPVATASALLRGAPWLAAIRRWQESDDRIAADTIEAVAASTPIANAAVLLDALEPLPAGLQRGPRLLFQILRTFDDTTEGAAR